MPNFVPAFYLELDITGVSLNNRIVLERYILPQTLIKSIIPNYGAYYTNSLQVYSVNSFNNSRTLLVRETDYVCVEFLPKTSADIGSEICFVILITNPLVSNIIDITYQALGGSDSPNKPLMLEIYRQMTGIDTTIEWADILYKPNEYPPAHHLHDGKDMYGLEAITDELRWIKADISLADNKIHSFILNKLNLINATVNSVSFKDIENINLDSVVSIIDVSKSNLMAADELLQYVQLKYNLAEKFFNRVNALYLSKGHTELPINSSTLGIATYSLYSNKTSVYEGDTVDFSIVTTNTVDGTKYKLKPYLGFDNDLVTITGADLVTPIVNEITVNKNVGTTVVSITKDTIIEGNKFLTYGLYDQNDVLLALSRNITINDGNVTTAVHSKFMPVDPYENKVTLYLKGDNENGSNKIVDSSINQKVITVYSNTVNGVTYSDFGNGSIKFDGAGDYLRVSPTTGVVLGVNDFTIESFMYFNNTDVGGFGSMATYSDPVNTYGISVAVSSGKINVLIGRSISNLFTQIKGTVSIIKGTWYHVAVTRLAGVVRLFINGIINGVANCSIDINNVNFVVGRTYPTNVGDYFNGYIDELKLTNGLARYISDFISLMPILPPDILDPYKNNTNLYLKGDGSNGSDFIEDSGIQAHRIVPLSGVKISTDQYVTGKSSMHFKGNSDNCPYIEHSSSLDLYNVNSWTIEFYVYLNSDTALFVLDKDGRANVTFPQYRITVNNTFISLVLGTGNGNAAMQILSTPRFESIANKWIHFAAVNNNKNIYLFVDGTKVLSKPLTAIMSTGGSRLTLGTEIGQKWNFDAYIDELKITKGVPRYIYPFTPLTVETVYDALRYGSANQNIPFSATDVVLYSIVPVKTFVREGDTLRFIVTTNDVNHNGYVDVSINKVTDTFTKEDYKIYDLAPTKLYIKDGLGKYDVIINKDLLLEVDELFNVSIWKLNKYNVPLAVSANVTIIDVLVPNVLPSNYLITSDKSTMNEGDTVTFTINTIGVVNGTTLYYSVLGIPTSLDFSEPITGQVIINNNTATVTLSTVLDNLTENTEEFNLLLFSDLNRLNILATSNTVALLDTSKGPSYDIVPNILNVIEGDTITYTVMTTKVNDGTVLYYTISGDITINDIVGQFNGDVTINNNSGFFTVVTALDTKTEMGEFVNVKLYLDVDKTTLVASNEDVMILDNKEKQVYSITPDVYTTNEGATVNFVVTTTPTIDGTIFYYKITGSVNNLDVTNATDGTVTIIDNTATIPIILTNDGTIEGDEFFAMSLYADSGYLDILTTSPSVVVIDSSVPYVVQTMPITLDEGPHKLSVTDTCDLPVTPNYGSNSLIVYQTIDLPVTPNYGSNSLTVDNLLNLPVVANEGVNKLSVISTLDLPTLLTGHLVNPEYAMVASVSAMNEGDTVTFTINTVDVQDNTTLYWTSDIGLTPNNCTVSDADFGYSNNWNNSNNPIVINNCTATFDLTAINDLTTEGVEILAITVRSAPGGALLVRAPLVYVNDTSLTPGYIAPIYTSPTIAPPSGAISYTVTLTSYNLNEGDTLNITATGGGTSNNTTLAFVTLNNSPTFDLADVTNWQQNKINIVAGTGSNNSVSLTADLLTEGVETIQIAVFDYDDWVASPLNGTTTAGPFLGVSQTITVNDTSKGASNVVSGPIETISSTGFNTSWLTKNNTAVYTVAMLNPSTFSGKHYTLKITSNDSIFNVSHLEWAGYNSANYITFAPLAATNDYIFRGTEGGPVFRLSSAGQNTGSGVTGTFTVDLCDSATGAVLSTTNYSVHY